MLADKILEHWNNIEENREWSNGLRASNSGKCPRQLAYQYHGFKGQPLNGRARLVFRLGDLIEKDLVEVAVKYGLSDMQKKCSVMVGDKEIWGSVDGILNCDTVVDFKSTTTFGFKLAKKGDCGDYKYQMTFYMKALGLKQALLVYYCKEQSSMCEILLKYDESAWQEIEDGFLKVINSTKENLPDRKYAASSTGKLPWQCSYCSYNQHCWPEYTLTFDNAGKPQLFII